MSAAELAANVLVYQLKVVLRDCSPLIWRRLLVSSDTTIAQLHAILQTAMGWEDLHLHRFRIHSKEYGIYREGGILFDDNPFQVQLSAFKLRPRERFAYEYDMGDFWQHDIHLEQVLPRDPHKTYPVCITGAGDCPPEDSGGPAGYQRLMEERSSWAAVEQMREDVLLVAQRLLAFYDGGPRPTYEDEEFVDALERMGEREAAAPVPFNRRTVNTALRKLIKEPPCNSASK
ncbi:MAG TPA: plasmid pRiA4b ORF-3 family protein [Gemmatimonadales bacterium]|nr:plasmid pRiA4b ORF-3 family protein [Gemmatimonadales bacterium]